MKRLLPAPLLSAALFALWLMLNQQLGIGHLLLAATLALAVPLLMRAAAAACRFASGVPAWCCA